VTALGATLANAVIAVWPRIATGRAGRLEVARRRLQLPRPRLSLRSCLGPWVPGGLTVGLDPALPAVSEMLAMAIGSRVAAVTIPGEMQMALGMDTKASARRRFSHVIVAGLSNDYLGYFLAAGRPARSDYMGCATLYGQGIGDLVQRAAAALLREVGDRAGARAAMPSSPASSPAPTSSARRCCGG
jgi:hypothetical protein